ncbi:DNA mismatch repair endonuclease MutL [Shewanella sp.]|uniref:DNA mismatch repair endonuclease MutL n=1 Tax=Shewanella sp. TaxID=50422 RepID=UPI003568C5BE
MAIQVLPPQLANQIAAGEVVERPASVIKELVENSLDAGATRVDIDIDKGGSKLIRIRDNGGGIPKDELALALARHATSKVQTLEDLEAILSFGFRGEALASISSVSRLTLTSRTAEQAEAWQAYAEGSEVALKVMPAAHPVGTTIEVADLFFNTPARRRFLKSDKTEFTHIDEWLKRIALVRSDVHFSLTHNGKPVRQFRAASTEVQYLQRLGQVAGRAFADTAIKVDCRHDGMHLGGYLQSPVLNDTVECHYFYVNGRLVRDRLVNHAVRQAFAECGALEQGGFVLRLDVDPHQVDVNVHPAKHEVRFHQARYVHDFILQVLQSALSQMRDLPLTANAPKDGIGSFQHNDGEPESGQKAVAESHASYRAESAEYAEAFTLGGGQQSKSANFASASVRGAAPASAGLGQAASEHKGYGASSGQGSRYVRDHLAQPGFGDKSGRDRQIAAQRYGELLSTPASTIPLSQAQGFAAPGAERQSSLIPMPPLLDGQYWVVCEGDSLRLLSLTQVAKDLLRQELIGRLPTGLIGQPLLMPVSVQADSDWADILQSRDALLRKMGLELTIRYQQLIIKKVPPYLRDSQLARLIPELLAWIQHEPPADEALASWLAAQVSSFEAAPRLWQRLQALDTDAQQRILESARELPWRTWLDEHKH